MQVFAVSIQFLGEPVFLVEDADSKNHEGWDDDAKAPVGAERKGNPDQHDERSAVHRVTYQPIQTRGDHLLTRLDRDGDSRVSVLDDHQLGDTEPDRHQHIARHGDRRWRRRPAKAMVKGADNQ
jgi:hypothetical protein